MITTSAFDHAARLESYALLAADEPLARLARASGRSQRP
jgi:hypothetical protein